MHRPQFQQNPPRSDPSTVPVVPVPQTRLHTAGELQSADRDGDGVPRSKRPAGFCREAVSAFGGGDPRVSTSTAAPTGTPWDPTDNIKYQFDAIGPTPAKWLLWEAAYHMGEVTKEWLETESPGYATDRETEERILHMLTEVLGDWVAEVGRGVCGTHAAGF